MCEAPASPPIGQMRVRRGLSQPLWFEGDARRLSSLSATCRIENPRLWSECDVGQCPREWLHIDLPVLPRKVPEIFRYGISGPSHRRAAGLPCTTDRTQPRLDCTRNGREHKPRTFHLWTSSSDSQALGLERRLFLQGQARQGSGG